MRENEAGESPPSAVKSNEVGSPLGCVTLSIVIEAANWLVNVHVTVSPTAGKMLTVRVAGSKSQPAPDAVTV